MLTDLVTRRVLRRLHGHAGKINGASFGAATDVLLSASYDGTVRVWDGRSRSRDPIQILGEAGDSVTAVEAPGGGGTRGDPSMGSGQILTASVDGRLRTYDMRRGELRSDDLGEPITGMALTHDGKCIAASCLDGTIRLLERSSGELLQTYAGSHKAGNYEIGCAVTANDSLVISGSEDGAVSLYGLVEGTPARAPLRGHGKATCSVAAQPVTEKPCVIVSASYDGQAAVWADPADVML